MLTLSQVPTDQAEPPLIAQARQALNTLKRVTWLTKKLWAPRAYKALTWSLAAVVLIGLNPAANAQAMTAAGSTSEVASLADFEFSSYEEVTPDEVEASIEEAGFATKPLVMATQMGTPEKELIQRQERERKETAARARAAQQAEAQRLNSNRVRGARGVAQATSTGASAPVATTVGSSAGNTYAKGYCTWWAKSKRPDLPNQLGNAGRWLGNAQGAGLSTGSTAKAGAVVVTREGPIGHVGYVIAVEGDQMIVSDMNMIGRGKVSQRTMSANASVIKGFIY